LPLAFIEIRDLYKIFGSNPLELIRVLEKGGSKTDILHKSKHTVALQNVSLEINRGETFVIMGLSGSGKSTLVRCMNRLIEPTAGKIWVDGKNVLAFDKGELQDFRRHKMNMVFQRFGLLPHRTVLENVAFGLEICGVDKQEGLTKAEEWIETVGLKGWETSYPHELSGGMQQRVGLARALCSDPEILLMDEPFSALDPLIRRQMQNELIDLAARINKTIIFITHDLDEALRLGDRIAILKDGRLVQVGTPEDILLDPATEYVVDFTRDVNLGRILTAETAMVTPYAIVSDRNGPRAAMEAMRKDNHSSVFVVNRQNQLQGLVTIDQALEAKKQNVKLLSEIELQEVNMTGPETPLDELLPMLADMKWPVAVVNDNNALLGIVPRVAILEALSRESSVEEVV
jgi:glycine betaine/proline transport system ATP-binding protein